MIEKKFKQMINIKNYTNSLIEPTNEKGGWRVC